MPQVDVDHDGHIDHDHDHDHEQEEAEHLVVSKSFGKFPKKNLCYLLLPLLLLSNKSEKVGRCR